VTVRVIEQACLDHPGYEVTAQYHVTAGEDEIRVGLEASTVEVVAALLTRRAADLVRQSRFNAAREDGDAKARNLTTALESSRVIGQAVGILMSRHRLTAEQGFVLLRTVSQHTHRKLRDLAAHVSDTGMLEVPRTRQFRTLRLVQDIGHQASQKTRS